MVRKCDLAPMFQIGFMIIDGTLHYYGYRVIYHCKRLAIGRANGISKVIRFEIFYDYNIGSLGSVVSKNSIGKHFIGI